MQRRRLHRERPFHRLKVRSKSWRCWPWIESPSRAEHSRTGTSQRAKPTEYIVQDMEILLQGVRLGQSPTLHVGMLVQPLNLPVKLDGTFGPVKESTDIDAINLRLALGKTDFTITGKTIGRNASLNISAPVINTANLPIALPLQKPVDVKDLQIAAEIQGQDVRLRRLSFQLFDGQVAAEGTVTSGSETPPFTGKMTIQGMQLDPALNALATTQVSISGTAGANLSVQGRGFSMPDLTTILRRDRACRRERRQDRRHQSASGSRLDPQRRRHLARPRQGHGIFDDRDGSRRSSTGPSTSNGS